MLMNLINMLTSKGNINEDPEINLTQENEKPIYEEFFTEKQSEQYDMILDFTSFKQLKQKGWTANFTLKGYEKYLNGKEINVNVIGVIGNKNRGKSFLLGRIVNHKNYIPPSGFLVTTYGISCNFPEVLKENNNEDGTKRKLKKNICSFPVITLDAAGKDNPLLQNAYNKDFDLQTISRDQKVTEIVLSDFIIQKANVLIAVIEQLTFAEQEMLKTLIERLKQKQIEEHDKRKLIVIHNLMNLSTIKCIEDFKKDILLKSLTFELKQQYMGKNSELNYDDSNKIFYIQTNLGKEQEKEKLQIYHFIIGNDNDEKIKKEYNEPAFRYIRDLIIVGASNKFDILDEFKKFIIKNSLKYLSGEKFVGLTNKSLIIGKEQKKKAYIDKEQKETADKIIIPIQLTDQNIVFETRKFKYDGENYTFFSNNEPRYSAKIIKKSKEEIYLEIIFEMFGKVKEINPVIDYDDSDNIIITIKGETEEDNQSKKTLIKSNKGELKYGSFCFQLKILKIIPHKINGNEYDSKKCYQINIQDEGNLKIDRNEKIGKYKLSFPVKIYAQIRYE